MNLFNRRLIEQTIKKSNYKITDKYDTSKDIITKIQTFLKKDRGGTKEKSIQSLYLQRIFEEILEYPSQFSGLEEYNLYIEPRTEYDSTEPDGALGFFNDSRIVKVVIELKPAGTDLDKKQSSRKDQKSPVEQGFGYSYKFDGCKWVIVSNFTDIRLYNTQRGIGYYENFDIFKLNNKSEFIKFHFLLSKKNLISKSDNSAVDLLIKETNIQEENITKKFYKKYKNIRIKLYNHIIENNPQIDKYLILEKVQKIIDRVIFICFCEDLGLLPYNIFRNILKNIESSFDLSDTKIWSQVKGLFHFINQGNSNKDINRFNGGLFAEDPILDNLVIQDEIIKELIQISNYNFESDLNVNILGHIFEQSIADIEEMKADISKTEKSETGKRKKEGIYYTPDYITKYIIETTISNWLNRRKIELGFDKLSVLNEDDYASIKFTKKRKLIANKRVKENIQFWEKYREILSNLKILDPACGSGAFLIQAFDFLYKEGQLVNDELAKLKSGQKQIFDLDKHILTNNIFGVDLNEESVQITKLSLWLKTANKEKELTALDDNIKCGNSLIDDPEISPKKAFNWKEEFKEIFTSGGFDIIIGNPPYGAELVHEEKKYLNSKFKLKSTETAILFISQSLFLLNEKGALGFIIPKSFCFASNYQTIRDNTYSSISTIIDCGKVWKEVKLEQIMIIFDKYKKHEKYLSGIRKENKILLNDYIDKLDAKIFSFLLNGVNNREISLAKKIKKYSFPLNKISTNKRGIILYNLLSDKGDFNVIGGAEISKYYIRKIRGKIIKKNVYSDNGYIKNNSLLVQGIVAHIENPIDHIKITAYIPNNKKYIIADNINQITLMKDYSPNFIWAILNSKLLNWYAYRFIYGKAIRTMRFDNPVTSRLPIPETSKKKRNNIIEKVKELLETYNSFHQNLNNSLEIMQIEFGIEKITTRLSSFFKLNLKELVLEFKKQKINLSIEKKEILQKWFSNKRIELQNLSNRTIEIENKIDQKIYQLYDLSEEEIYIIEGKTK